MLLILKVPILTKNIHTGRLKNTSKVLADNVNKDNDRKGDETMIWINERK